MDDATTASDDHRTAHASAALARRYGRIAGILLLLSMVGGGLGEVYIPSQIIVAGDAAATAHNIVASQAYFRLGFAAYLLEAVCDIALALVFYLLLKPVRTDVALLSAFFGLVSTSVFCVAELFYFASTLLVGGADYLKSFTPDQLNTLAMLSLKLFSLVSGIFMALYGIVSLLRGYLMFRSGYIPKAIGALLMVAGAGFVVQNLVLVLAPAFASFLFVAPMMFAVLPMTVWFLGWGVDMAGWEERVGAA